MNTAIDHFILYEVSELRAEEQRLNSALAGAPAAARIQNFLQEIATLEARIENLDSVLDELELPTRAFSGSPLYAA
jgi:hypothetical protein